MLSSVTYSRFVVKGKVNYDVDLCNALYTILVSQVLRCVLASDHTGAFHPII